VLAYGSEQTINGWDIAFGLHCTTRVFDTPLSCGDVFSKLAATPAGEGLTVAGNFGVCVARPVGSVAGILA
jgi:hypothetical protein